MSKNIISITLITVIAGLLLGLTYTVTKKPIEKSKISAVNNAYKKIIKEADEFKNDNSFDSSKAKNILKDGGIEKDIITSIVEAYSKGSKIGYIINVTSKEGFGGDIELSVGILNDGSVSSIEILSINETAGLGMKATEEDFKGQFNNKKVENFKYTKTDISLEGEINAISGATVTTNAVTNAVNSALYYFNKCLAE